MPRAYTRDQLTDALVAAIARVNPTVIRTLDPTPLHAPRETVAMMSAPTILRGLSYLDHQDHTASARFMQAAMERYWGAGKGRAGVGDQLLRLSDELHAAVPGRGDHPAQLPSS